MPIHRNEIEKYFSVNDIIASGGGRTYFQITEISNDKVRIQPTAANAASRLSYDKLSVVISNFQDVDPNRIEATVRGILEAKELRETQNETYLYGMAREYLKRKSLFIESKFEKAVEEAKKSNSTERRARLKDAPKKPKQVSVISTIYQRNPDVVAEVLDRAKGVCEACKANAPFLRAKDKTPYLEIHHRIQLTHGGDDTVENAIALCPNCHRKVHFGINI